MSLAKFLQGWGQPSAQQFAWFRIMFGVYLTVHFGTLLPWAGELFSHSGLVAEAGWNPSAGLFPSPFAWNDSPLFAQVFITLLTLASLLFAMGKWRRSMAWVLWFGATALFHRNNLTANPSLAYVGLLLVLCGLIPPGESVSAERTSPGWRLPALALPCAWLLLAVGYTFSGLAKLGSPSWVDGTAILRLLDNPLARDWPLRMALKELPIGFFRGLTWGTLILEISFIGFALHSTSRKWVSLAMIGMHLGILLVVDFADLTFGMLMIHLFCWDARWLRWPPCLKRSS